MRQWKRRGGFEDFVGFIKFSIIIHQVIFTVYFPHQIDIIIHVSIPKLDRFSAEQKLLVILFLPRTIREWNKLDTSIYQAASYSVFRKALLDFIRPTANSTFGTNDASGSKLLTRLRVGFSHLRNINLNIIFKIYWTHCAHVPLKQKTPVTFSCTAKFFLINEMSFLMTLIQLTQEIIKTSENQIVQVLLFGNKCFSKDINFRIITSSIRFIEDSKRFDESLSTWEKPFWYIFTTGIKPKNIFSPSVSAFYVTYLLWRAVKFSFCACIVLYISFFLSLV